jgi:CheY-like chemotaxis protein
LRVLVIDDDPDSLESLSRLLIRKGFDVTTVEDSREALQTALEVRPDVVVLDFLMPELHGGEVAWQLASHAELCDTRVVVASGYDAEEIRRTLPPTRIPILPKPVDFDALLSLIDHTTNERRGRSLAKARAASGGRRKG